MTKRLFENQVILGDCLEKMKDIADDSIDLILTNLPYGMTARNKWDSIIPYEQLWKEWNRIKRETTPVILTAIQPFTSKIIMSNLTKFKYEWIWNKKLPTGFLNAKKQPLRQHESILVFYDKQSLYIPQFTEGEKYKKTRKTANSLNYNSVKYTDGVNESGKRYPKTILDISNACHHGRLHPTEKPVKLFEYLIKTYTNEGDTVLDCCAGSGTTAIACLNLNRNYICIEKEPKYYEIMKERINTLKNVILKTITEPEKEK